MLSSVDEQIKSSLGAGLNALWVDQWISRLQFDINGNQCTVVVDEQRKVDWLANRLGRKIERAVCDVVGSDDVEFRFTVAAPMAAVVQE